MNTNTTIPCPVCEEPVNIRYLRSPEGMVTKILTDPIFSNDEVFSFHLHQAQDIHQQHLH